MHAYQVCPECDRKVYGVASHYIVGPKNLQVATSAVGLQKLVILSDPPAGNERLWAVGAVPKPRRFLANWHWRHRQEPAVFRSYRHACNAIREWWRQIHKIHRHRPDGC